MSADPRATVVVTTRDRPEFARRALASALAQTIHDIEVVVVDDGSTPPFDPCSDDPRLRLLRRGTAGGMCVARNDGLRAARGEWIAFLDDDDELPADAVAGALAAATASTLPSPVAVMGAMAIVGPDGRDVDRARAPAALPRGAHWFLSGGGDFRAKNSLVMPTGVVRAIGGWADDLPDWEADDFGLRLNAAASIQGVDAELYRLTQHPGVRVSRRWRGIARDMEVTLARHRSAFLAHRAAHAQYLARIGMYHLRAGDWWDAVRFCARGVVRDPRRARRWAYLGAAVAGPYAVRAARVVRPRGTSVSTRELMRRRVRKYAKRGLDVPRALVGVPAARVTRALASRRGVLRSSPTRALVLCIYRARHAARVEAVVADATARGWSTRLWALDEAAPSLARWTEGEGPGAKFPLLNRLLAAVDVATYDWVVVVDDDLDLPDRALDELLAVATAAGFELAQPAHTERSHRDNDLAVRRPLSVARATTFVEIGPVFAVARALVPDVMPFPADHAMGWGLELEWYELARRGARLGIVDLVAVRHVEPVGAQYRKRDEADALRARLRAHGLGSLAEIQRTLGTWRPWRSGPPWEVVR